MSSIPDEFRVDAEAMPEVLRELLKAELEAGNVIVAVSHSHPAPPVGACFMLAQPVTTRPRASGNGLMFRERASSLYSGEFTDAVGYFFITESPLPPPPEPDMDAIRAAANARSQFVPSRPSFRSEVVDRFHASMTIDYEKWHDGIGYALDEVPQASAADKEVITQLVTPPKDWRDVETLAALATPDAITMLRQLKDTGSSELKAAVASYAPHVLQDAQRATLLVSILEQGEFYGGLTSALLEVEAFHPAPVVDALFRGLFLRPGDVACNFAGMLVYVHGHARSSFEWSKRPLFLRFNTDDQLERQRAFHDLCALIEVDAGQVLDRIDHSFDQHT